MPLVHSEIIGDKKTIFLWELVESEFELLAQLGNDLNFEDLHTISHPQKRREWLASRLLIKMLVEHIGLVYYGTYKDDNGKGFLINHDCHISLTHTNDYVAVAINLEGAIGIDMEKMDVKLSRVASKFLSNEEFENAFSNVKKQCIFWCSKEALYKLHGRKKVSFKNDITISQVCDSSKLVFGVLRDNAIEIKSSIHIRWIDDYCIAISV